MTASVSNTFDPEEFILRLGFIGTGLVLFGVGLDLALQAEPFRHPFGFGLAIVAWAVGIALTAFALTTSVDSRLAWLILAGLLFALLARAYLDRLDYSPLTTNHTDNEMVAIFAVQALKRGQNPYTWNYSDMLRAYRDRGLLSTPFWDGTFQTRLTYPALPTWIFTLLSLLGIEQVRPVILAIHLLLLLLVFVGTSSRVRPVVLLPLFLLRDLASYTLNGTQDIVWSACLVGVVLTWQRPVWRAVLFGLASAYRQQPWFVAPFLLIYLWNEPGTVSERWHRIAHFVGISVGMFFLINLPFILWDPRSWWLGVFEPGYALLNVYSFGLSSLSQYGLLPFPRPFYNVLQASSLVSMLVLHWRHPRSIAQAFWIFPAIFFWFFYHGVPNYWMYWVPPLLLSLTKRLEEGTSFHPSAPVTRQSSRWMRTVALIVPILSADLLWGIVLLQRDPLIETDYRVPLELAEYGHPFVSRLRIGVTNVADTALVPRFAVQRDPGVQPFPWVIDSGPEELPPGQSAEYVISARILARAFPVDVGAQIVVRDAGGDYWKRVVQTIPPDSSFAGPDLIANPGFSYWPSGGNAPAAWSLQAAAGGSGAAELDSVGGRTALTLQLTRDPDDDNLATVRLEQVITFPPEFAIWAYPTVPSSDPLQQAYGVELDDGEHRLWILFGDSDGRGSLGENSGYVYMSSPLKVWSRHVIRPAELYDLFGWQLPSFSLRHRNGLAYRARQTQLSLLIASRSQAKTLGIFGPIEQNDELLTRDVFLAEALESPETYYINLGDEYHQQRNYDLAQGAYRQALAYDPTNAEAHFRLAEASFWRDDWSQALEAFENSILYGYGQPALAYRGMGWAHYNLGEFDQAERAFEEAVQLDPNLADAYNGLGWVLLRDRRCEEAIPYFEHARALAPDFPDPQRGIEECTGSQ